MDNFTILGAGAAGRALVEEVRRSNGKCVIKIIDKHQYYFSNDELISQPGSVKNRIDLQNWAKEKEVKLINDEVERINIRRKKIFFKGETEVDSFENLVVSSGLVSKKIPIKGQHHDGFFYLSSFEPFVISDLLKLYQEATIFVSTWLGIKLCLALVSLGKEVRLVAANLDFLKEFKEQVINLLNSHKNIFLHIGSWIEEIVGESRVKAVKIAPLKVFSSQLVFVDSGLEPNLKFFEEEVNIKNKFFTEWEGVYLLGAVNNFSANQEAYSFKGAAIIKEQVIALTKYMFRQETISGEGENWDPNERRQVISHFLGEFKPEENKNDISLENVG